MRASVDFSGEKKLVSEEISMYYPEWKETREGMWAAELKFPMIDGET